MNEGAVYDCRFFIKEGTIMEIFCMIVSALETIYKLYVAGRQAYIWLQAKRKASAQSKGEHNTEN